MPFALPPLHLLQPCSSCHASFCVLGQQILKYLFFQKDVPTAFLPQVKGLERHGHSKVWQSPVRISSCQHVAPFCVPLQHRQKYRTTSQPSTLCECDRSLGPIQSPRPVSWDTKIQTKSPLRRVSNPGKPHQDHTTSVRDFKDLSSLFNFLPGLRLAWHFVSLPEPFQGSLL